MTTYRTRPQRDFTAIRNSALRDERLSLKAKGLLAMMLTFPPDWTYRQSHLEKLSTDGRDALRGAVRELEACGYIRRTQTRSEDGRVGTADYVVDDVPAVDGFSGDGKTVDGLSGDGKPATTKNEGTKTEVYEEGDYEPPSPPTNGQANEPNGHADEDTFDPKALRKLQESDLETFKRVEQRANALNWQFRHKTLAAMRALRDPPSTIAAMDATIEGADATGAKAYRYFKAVLTGDGPKPNGQTKEPDEDQARAMRRNIGRLGRHPTLGEIRPTSVALNLEHYNVGNGPPAKPEDIQWLE